MVRNLRMRKLVEIKNLPNYVWYLTLNAQRLPVNSGWLPARATAGAGVTVARLATVDQTVAPLPK